MFSAIFVKNFKLSRSDNQKTAISVVIDGNDIFVGTKTGSGKSLTYECFPVIKADSTVLIIGPLVTIMSEQFEKLEKCGFGLHTLGKMHSSVIEH